MDAFTCSCCRSKPSPLYADIKVAAELAESQQVHQKGQELGLVTQVVVAERTGETSCCSHLHIGLLFAWCKDWATCHRGVVLM